MGNLHRGRIPRRLQLQTASLVPCSYTLHGGELSTASCIDNLCGGLQQQRRTIQAAHVHIAQIAVASGLV